MKVIGHGRNGFSAHCCLEGPPLAEWGVQAPLLLPGEPLTSSVQLPTRLSISTNCVGSFCESN